MALAAVIAASSAAVHPAVSHAGTIFGPGTSHPLPPGSFALAVGDFNRDGKADFALLSRGRFTGNSSVTIYLGNGDGTFRTGTTLQNTPDPGFISVADVNRDGNLDIILSNQGRGVAVCFGDGAGGFAQCTPVFATDLWKYGVFGDFNGSGHTDLATTLDSNNTVNIYQEDSASSNKYNQLQSYSVAGAQQIIAANFGGAGRPDLAVTGRAGVSVLPNTSTPSTVSLGAPVLYPIQGTNVDPIRGPGLVAADFNGDGKLDIGLAGEVLLGNGDGTFRPAIGRPVGNRLNDAGIGDVNGDGKLDEVVLNTDAQVVDVLLGTGDGTFQPPMAIPVSPYAFDAALADVAGNGKLALIVVDQGRNFDDTDIGSYTVYLNQASSATPTPTATPGGSGGASGGAATPELGSAELVLTGLVPVLALALYRRRAGNRRASRA